MTVVSVIIPVYKQAQFLAEAIQSVLDQTYAEFELIVVDDASPDNAAEVVQGFRDKRLRYIAHEQNRGLPATRNTGIRASSGEIIALLDADDVYHPDKLGRHVAFLDENPAVGVSYNARFNFVDSPDMVFSIWEPPASVQLADLVQGFPFAPSDMVIRRDWLLQVGLFDESYTYFSEDLDINCRLALAGCRFAKVEGALNYRRYHLERYVSNLSLRMEAALKAQETVFADVRCPEDVRALRHNALASTCLVWAYYAFLQEDTSVGQQLVCQAYAYNPLLFKGQPRPIVCLFTSRVILSEHIDYEVVLEKLFAQLPPETKLTTEEYQWALQESSLAKIVQTIIWKGKDVAQRYAARAAELGATPSEALLRATAYQLLVFEREFGPEKTATILNDLASNLNALGHGKEGRWLRGCYAVNKAFDSFHSGEFAKVPEAVAHAVRNDPRLLGNRGVLAMFVRSIISSGQRTTA
jgi:glycosyltransferase involved in cell wall biosynthesis